VDFKEYQYHAALTAVYPPDNEREYLALGLLAEVGELAGVLAKHYRGDGGDLREKVLKEAGDVAWFVAQICRCTHTPFCDPHTHLRYDALTDLPINAMREATALAAALLDGAPVQKHSQALLIWLRLLVIRFDLTMDEVMQANLRKLADRQARGVLMGNGDER
jgi:hypothetical protein